MRAAILAIVFVLLPGCVTLHSPNPEPVSRSSMESLFEKAKKGLQPQPNQVHGLKIVEIWASYCEACEATALELELLYQHFGQCVQFMSLYVDEDSKKPLQFAQKLKLSYPIGPDPDLVFSKTLFLEVLPTIFVFNAKNELIFTQSGNDRGFSQKLADFITDSAKSDSAICDLRSSLPKHKAHIQKPGKVDQALWG